MITFKLGQRSFGINWNGFRFLLWLMIAVSMGIIFLLLVHGDFFKGILLSGFVLSAIIFMALTDRIPTLLDFLFVTATLLNAGGWLWGYYATIGPYDEFAHAYTTFSFTAIFSTLMFHSMRKSLRNHVKLFVVTIVSFGLSIGALWEVIEWVIDLLFGTTTNEGLDDSMLDLVMDTLGAVLAVPLTWRTLCRKKPTTLAC